MRERERAARVKKRTKQNRKISFSTSGGTKNADGQRHRTDRGPTESGGRPRFARKRQKQREICVTMAGMGWLSFRSVPERKLSLENDPELVRVHGELSPRNGLEVYKNVCV